MVSWPDIIGLGYFIVSLPMVAVVYNAWQHRNNPVGFPLAVSMSGAVGWALVVGLALIVDDVGLTVMSVHARNFFIAVAAIGWLYVAAEYTGREWLKRPRYVALIAVVPVLDQVVGWTNSWHHLMYTQETTVIETGTLLFEPGIYFVWVHIVWSYLLMVTAAVLLFDEFRTASGVYRSQCGTLLGGEALVLLANIVTYAGVLPVEYVDLTPIGFMLAGVVFMLALFRFELLEVVPLARERLITDMADGMIALDKQNRIVDLNARAKSLFDLDREMLGMDCQQAFGAFPELLEAITDPPQQKTLTITQDGKDQYYHVEASPVYYQGGLWWDSDKRTLVGQTLVIRDITDQKRREHELTRQNERLDQFTNVVAHDLRNPLNVLSIRFDLVREDLTGTHAAAIDRNLERMEAMIDDLLTMARVGQTVEETEPIRFVSVAREAWDHVNTVGADFDLRVSEDVTIQADRDRLLHVFENLFRNATDHNDSPLTIRVDILDTSENLPNGTSQIGFFIEDDGDGISEDKWDDVFEHGYTTNDNGTGFGLSIVGDIVKAHGWNIRVAEETSGGARFEITGVETSR